MIATICAWCKEIIKDGRCDCPFSHGICKECFEKVERKHELDLLCAQDLKRK
jgi:hypothetical protein